MLTHLCMSDCLLTAFRQHSENVKVARTCDGVQIRRESWRETRVALRLSGRALVNATVLRLHWQTAKVPVVLLELTNCLQPRNGDSVDRPTRSRWPVARLREQTNDEIPTQNKIKVNRIMKVYLPLQKWTKTFQALFIYLFYDSHNNFLCYAAARRGDVNSTK